MSPVAEPAVSLRGVGRSFGDSVAVQRIDLELAAGEFFALLGPSGCGKTTTLRMIGGFDLPTTGQILLEGRDVTGEPPYKRDVNTVFQSYALFPHLTVFDNVAFGLRGKKLRSPAVRSTVERHLEMVGLAGYGKRRPAQLSGGQQQRIALARALVNEPRVLLLDEPMGALDAKIRKSMQPELKRIQREVGITFLYVTHDQAEAMSMADRLAVMNGGIIEDIGAPERVYDRPATEFVAGFLGTCNILPAAAPGGPRIGIRPEKLQLATTERVTSDHRLTGRVTSATYLGGTTEYEIETAPGVLVKAHAQNLDSEARARVGDAVTLTWNPAHSFELPAAE